METCSATPAFLKLQLLRLGTERHGDAPREEGMSELREETLGYGCFIAQRGREESKTPQEEWSESCASGIEEAREKGEVTM